MLGKKPQILCLTKALLLAYLVCFSLITKAQQKTVADKIELYQKALPKEKIYLTFDKTNYSAGDTIWFKSILLNADYSNTSKRTDKIYVELFNDSSKLIQYRVILLNNGLGYGDFALKSQLPDGAYTIRAYSNWQQNFASAYFFQKSLYIGNAGEKTWLLDSYQKLILAGNTRTLDLKVRITNIKNEAVGLKDVELYLMNDDNRLMKTEMQTTVAGNIETIIPISANKITGNYSVYIVDKKDKSKKAKLPILLQDIGEVDLQFMPEGGYLVNGIYSKVAFKAIDIDGMGKTVSGKIVNAKNETVADMTTTHKGMGNFHLFPQKGDSYTAIYTVNGKEQRKELQQAKDEGTTLRIDQLSKPDSLYIYIKASESRRIEQNYELVAQSSGTTVMAILINLKKGFFTLKLPKKDFPDGVIHFTLFSPGHLPLNERQAFINKKQTINLQINTDKAAYKLKDSIAVEITATKEDGMPMQGSFAVAVTDNNQVKLRNDEDNIVSYFLLQSDIKGTIEEASWYFRNNDPFTLLALDQLLLTQAWIGYNWDEILKSSPTAKFKAEKGNQIEGKIEGLFKKPMANAKTSLLSLSKTLFVTDTISNSEGKFVFKDLPYIDTAAYAIKIKNAKGKTTSANIFVDEFTPVKESPVVANLKPWYVNVDSTSSKYFENLGRLNKQDQVEKIKRDGNLLNEVEIIGQRKLEEFMQKNAWDAKFVKKIEEEELKQIPKKTLYDLLKEKIIGFNMNGPKPNFYIGSSLISQVIIDKINTLRAASGIEDDYNATGVSATESDPNIFATNRYIFNTLSAADIKEITIYKGNATQKTYYYLDITTRSGKGPWINPSDGVYVYRPLPVYIPREFYSPKYGGQNTSSSPDLRSTIYWDANVVTDEYGKAKFSFYSSDLPGPYTIKMEGTDLQGRFGYKKVLINVGTIERSK